jgi:hypothetical protein
VEWAEHNQFRSVVGGYAQDELGDLAQPAAGTVENRNALRGHLGAVTQDMTQTPPEGDFVLNDIKHLVRLRNAQRLTYERYLEIAERIHARLATLTPESASDLDRVNLETAKRLEAAAHAAYAKARAELIGYLFGARRAAEAGR